MKRKEEHLILYTYWRSSCSYRVRIALNLKNLPYESKYIQIRNGEQSKTEFTELNPNQTVPVLIVNGVPLQQSLAIIEYLDEIYPDPPLLPKDPIQRAEVRTLALLIAADVQPLQNTRILEAYSGGNVEKKNEWAHTVNENGLSRFEKAITNKAGKYCYGDQITLADLCLVPQVYNGIRFKVDVTKFPILNRVYNNLINLEAFKKAYPENQPDAETLT